MRVNSKRGKVRRAAPFSPCERLEWKGGNEVARRRSRRLRFVKECLRVVIRSVCKNFVDMRRAVAYIRYHIVFQGVPAGVWFVARLESAMETSGQDRFSLVSDGGLVAVSGIEPVER